MNIKVGTTEFSLACSSTPSGLPVYLIKDLDKGGMSVTNNVENVIQSISDKLSITLPDSAIVIYRDSVNTWDGIAIKNGTFADFYLLGTTNEQKAVDMAEQLLNRQKHLS